MKNQINELIDLILDFGRNLYPILREIQEANDESDLEFTADETKWDITDIKRMLEKKMAKDSYQKPAYLDCEDDDEDNYGDCASEPIIEEADEIIVKKKKKRFPITDEDDDIENSRSFSLRQDHMLAIADLSRIDRVTVQEYLNQEVRGTWFFFNRLNVPKGMRRKGIARELLYKVILWADKNQYNILNVVSPSGDLTIKQLTALYEKFGFEKISRGLMVRKHIVHVSNVYDDVEEENEGENEVDFTDHISESDFINDQEKREFFDGHLHGR